VAQPGHHPGLLRLADGTLGLAGLSQGQQLAQRVLDLGAD
jgi:hypothetical protein